jgi:hypothetical protein
VVTGIKLRIVSRVGKEVNTSALVNSDFEAETPQLLLLRSLMSLVYGLRHQMQSLLRLVQLVALQETT